MTRTLVVAWVAALVVVGALTWTIGRLRQSGAAVAASPTVGTVDPVSATAAQAGGMDTAGTSPTVDELKAGAPITTENVDAARARLQEHEDETKENARQQTAAVDAARSSLESGESPTGPE